MCNITLNFYIYISAKQEGNRLHLLVDQYNMTLWVESSSLDDFISVLHLDASNQPTTLRTDQQKLSVKIDTPEANKATSESTTDKVVKQKAIKEAISIFIKNA